jgi:glycosyltransferase involved in cell wall biosynthesis
MFWGRLAARRCGVPVILSALHSTGWPDVIGRLNRLLTPITDRFIAVAQRHAQYLSEVERFPEAKICVISNGVDTDRFTPGQGVQFRREIELAAHVPVAGIVAALRPEKDHELFLRAAALVLQRLPEARFLVVGDGPLRAGLESTARSLGIADAVRFLGTRQDIPAVLQAMDVFVLTSKMEANPVSILEALSCGTPVIASRVGSIPETVQDGVTGYLVQPSDAEAFAARILDLLQDRQRAVDMGRLGREFVIGQWSLDKMVRGYERLIEEIYSQKSAKHRGIQPSPVKVESQIVKACR